jgi:hypothetical protein
LAKRETQSILEKEVWQSENKKLELASQIDTEVAVLKEIEIEKKCLSTNIDDLKK